MYLYKLVILHCQLLHLFLFCCKSTKLKVGLGFLWHFYVCISFCQKFKDISSVIIFYSFQYKNIYRNNSIIREVMVDFTDIHFSSYSLVYMQLWSIYWLKLGSIVRPFSDLWRINLANLLIFRLLRKFWQLLWIQGVKTLTTRSNGAPAQSFLLLLYPPTNEVWGVYSSHHVVWRVGCLVSWLVFLVLSITRKLF